MLDGLNAEYYSRKGKEAVLHVREWSMDAIILCDVSKNLKGSLILGTKDLF